MKETPPDEEHAALLWTGGWDSTFQLLRLLIIHRRRVTPFYLIDAERQSTGMEILTMRRIKDHLLREYPHTRELLRPTQYFEVTDISPDSETTEAFQSLLKRSFMGSQYDWLARFCKEKGITDMQLCVHRDDKAHFVIEQIVLEGYDGFQSVFRVDPKFKGTNEHALFQHFAFPIFKLSKIQMSAIANEQGWEKIMGMTWFCHRPTASMKPCGKCSPCLYTIEEGLGWRIPASNRMLSFFYRTFIRPMKSKAEIALGKPGSPKDARKSA